MTPQRLLAESVRPAQVFQGGAEKLLLPVVQVSSAGLKKTGKPDLAGIVLRLQFFKADTNNRKSF